MSGQRVGEIVVAGRSIPVYSEGNSGQTFVPSNIEREIVLDFIGRALATPVTAITIVGGGALRDIRLTYERVVQDIDSEVYRVRAEGELRRMKNVLHVFGTEIQNLSNYDYPEDVKRMHGDNLKRRMIERYKSFKN